MTKLFSKSARRSGTRFVLALLLLVGLAALAAPAMAQGTLPEEVWTTRNVFLRAGPGMGFRILAEMPGGEHLTVLGQSGIWINVERADDTEGFVSGSFVTASPPGSGGGGGVAGGGIYAAPTQVGDIAMVNTPLLNVRSGPGVNRPIVSQLSSGTLVLVLAKNGAWRQIQYGNAQKGYVNGQFLVRVDTVQNVTGNPNNPTTLPITTVVTPPNAKPLEVNIVTTPQLNVRVGPSTLYAVTTVVGQDQFVTVLAKDGGWYYIQTPGGARGWSNVEGLTRCDCVLP